MPPTETKVRGERMLNSRWIPLPCRCQRSTAATNLPETAAPWNTSNGCVTSGGTRCEHHLSAGVMAGAATTAPMLRVVF